MRIAGLFALTFIVSACHRELHRPGDDDEPGDTGGVETSGDVAPAPDTFETLDAADTAVVDSTTEDSVFDAGPDTTAGDATDAAVDTTPDSAACEAGTLKCAGTDGRQLTRCDTDGASSVIATCPSASTCDATLGRCTFCSPGAFSCSGATRMQCDTYGASTTMVAACATAELCAASTGTTCAAPACMTGEKSCSPDATQLLACNAGRTAFAATTCPAGCEVGACLKIAELAAHPTNGMVCARYANLTVRCWTSARPSNVTGVTAAAQIAVGMTMVGARLTDGTIRLWTGYGDSSGGPDAPGPGTPFAGIAGAEDLALGGAHGCVRLSGGVVKCWGDNGAGQLGNGTTTSSFAPALVTASGVTAAGRLSLGAGTSFAIVVGGAKGWGSNDVGQLGFGSAGNKLTPTSVFADATQIAASSTLTCARTSTSKALCSGLNDKGQLGIGAVSGSPYYTPVSVIGLDGLVASVTTGFVHACALLADKTVRCWGENASGQLGNGSTTPSASPVVVGGLTGVRQIVAAPHATCALLEDNETVKCWGDFQSLGASLTANSSTPVTVTF